MLRRLKAQSNLFLTLFISPSQQLWVMERLPLGLRTRVTKRNSDAKSHSVRRSSDTDLAVRDSRIPQIVIDKASSRSSSLNSSTVDQTHEIKKRKEELTIVIREQFEKAAIRDTYQCAATTMGNLIMNTAEEGDDSISQQLYRETLEMVKQTSGSWGIRFSCWSVTMLIEYHPWLSAVNFSFLSSACFPSLLSASDREDDVTHVAEFIKKVLPLISEVLRSDSDSGSGNASCESGIGFTDYKGDDVLVEGMRYFHHLIAPLIPNLSSNGVNQRWASIGLAAILQSSEEPLLSTSGGIYGPCNGEADDVLIPLFGTISSLFCSLDAKVFPEARPAFLQLFETTLDSILSLSSYHSPLFSVADLLPVSYEEVLQVIIKLLKHNNWKVRIRTIEIFTTLTKGGSGSRWRPVPSKLEDVVSVLRVLSKTDRIKSIRERCKEVVIQLDDIGHCCHLCGAQFAGDPFCGQCGTKSGQPPLSETEQLRKFISDESTDACPLHFEHLYSQVPIQQRKKLLLEVARRLGWSENPNLQKCFILMLRSVSNCLLSTSHATLLLEVLERRCYDTTTETEFRDIKQLLINAKENPLISQSGVD